MLRHLGYAFDEEPIGTTIFALLLLFILRMIPFVGWGASWKPPAILAGIVFLLWIRALIKDKIRWMEAEIDDD